MVLPLNGMGVGFFRKEERERDTGERGGHIIDSVKML